jgi:hypothetical protein
MTKGYNKDAKLFDQMATNSIAPVQKGDLQKSGRRNREKINLEAGSMNTVLGRLKLGRRNVTADRGNVTL